MGVVVLEAAAVACRGLSPGRGVGLEREPSPFLARLQELGLESRPVPIHTHDAGDNI